MLCPADANLVKRDPGLPGLAMILDPDAFTAMLQGLYPDAGVTGCVANYVRYKPATSCLVGYRVSCAAGTVDVYARAHDSDGAKIEKAGRHQSAASALGGGVRVLTDRAVAVYPFPNDHELRMLPRLQGAGSRRDMLREMLPDRPDLSDAPLETLRYKPERRYVARLGAPGAPGAPGAVLKLYTREEFGITGHNAGRFVSEPPLRVPRGLARSKSHRASVVEWIAGVPLREALVRSEVPESSFRAIGAALAKLHAQKPNRLRRFSTAEGFAQTLADGADALADIVPELGSRAQRLARRIGEKLASRHWRARRAIHGDFSADQVVLQDDPPGAGGPDSGGIAIVDFDRAGKGEPRLDLGMFRARMEYDVILGVLAPEKVSAYCEPMLDEYRRASDKDITRKLDRFTGACLMLIALEPFRHRLPEWPEKIEMILCAAERIFEGQAVAS